MFLSGMHREYYVFICLQAMPRKQIFFSLHLRGGTTMQLFFTYALELLCESLSKRKKKNSSGTHSKGKAWRTAL